MVEVETEKEAKHRDMGFGKLYQALSLPRGTGTDWRSAFLQQQQLLDDVQPSIRVKSVDLSNDKKPNTKLLESEVKQTKSKDDSCVKASIEKS